MLGQKGNILHGIQNSSSIAYKCILFKAFIVLGMDPKDTLVKGINNIITSIVYNNDRLDKINMKVVK